MGKRQWAVVAYAVIGGAWVLFSSVVAGHLHESSWLEPVKGVAFVLVTALALGAVLRTWERSRVATDTRYRSLIEHSGEVVYRVDLTDGVRLEYVSPGMADLLGFPDDRSFTLEQAWRLIHPEDRPLVPVSDQFVLVPNLRVLAFDGRVVHIAQASQGVYDRHGRLIALDVRLRDVTSEVHNEAEIGLRNENGVWLEDDRPVAEVLTRACMAVVERFDVDLAWVGWRRPDGRLEVLAKGGVGAYLDGAEIRWDEGPLAHGPTGTAIREARAVVSRSDDPAFAPWRARASTSGFTSTLAVPIRMSGEVIGSLNVYARFGVPFEPGAVARYERVATLLGFVLQRADDVARIVRAHGVERAVERLRAGSSGRDLVVVVAMIGRLAALRRSAGFGVGEDGIHNLESTLRAAAPAEAEVLRTGEDEVTLVVAADVLDGDRMTALFTSLRVTVMLSDEQLELPLAVGCSGRVASIDDSDVAYRRAVSAAVTADSRHDSAIVWASDELEVEAQDLATLAALRRAVDAGELEVWYQPQCCVDTATVTAAEALVRWRRSDGRMVPPLDFLPLAEQDGCIVAIGRAVIERALTDAERFRTAGLERMSVNASVHELVAPGYVDHLVESLHRHRLPASFLEVELVETAQLGPAAAAVLAELQAAGVRVAVDDYGTGWSSMAYLVQFRFDTLKIDRLFVQDMSVDPRARSLVEATIALGTALGVLGVAEDVD